MQFKKVLVAGGAGYKGSVLVPKLLEKGYQVVVYDNMLFGAEALPRHANLQVVEGDIRETAKLKQALQGCDAVIHLAAIANDPSFELNPDVSLSINLESMEPFAQACKEAGVKRLVYASSSSVYGVSDAPEVTEEHPLVPLTDYNKYKGLSEPILLKHNSPDFTVVVVRPATVCGYSPRMRLDLTINILTSKAIRDGVIPVYGGSQKRPNIHVEDIAELYVDLLEMPAEKIAGETFNAGYENFTVAELAEMVKKVVEEEFPEKAPVRIETTSSNDLRSYHVSSRKIKDKLGWEPKRSLYDAIRDVCRAFKEGRLRVENMDEDRFHNVRSTMKAELV